ncbi:MAG: hypothetical protein CMJ31_03270, partial [Phycisphaerae bacterium]|nr:hypothetical protein [Phycisphaerae bacterium]
RAIINEFAVELPDEAELQRAAIDGMIGALDDPYAVYVPAEDNEDFEKGLTGEYVGIGAEVITRDGFLEIVTPLDGSPAFRAGVMAGDRVLEIDGESTEGKSVDESIEILKGDPKTPVTLLIDRDGDEIEVEVIRDVIRTPSVRGFHRRDDDATWQYVIDRDRGIAYVRLNQFLPDSAAKFDAALDEAEAQLGGEIEGLIIDLRWNPGGLLDQAIEMADLFLEDGVIVSTKGRGGVDERIARAERNRGDRDCAIAILINGASASASEVLAGALTENDRAIAVGTRTFGKGSVQTVRSLAGAAAGSVIKLTEQRYYLPSGRSIQRQEDAANWGVDPTAGFFVGMTDKETSEMLAKRRQQEIIGADEDSTAVDWSSPDSIVEALKDPQLAAAVKALHVRVETGEWAAVSEDNAESDPAVVDELRGVRRMRERLLLQVARLERQADVLETALASGEEPVSRADVDLVPDDVDLTGGEMDLFNKSGDLVATLRITDANIERWLIDAGVERIDGGRGEAPPDQPGDQPAEDPAGE